MNHFCLNCGNQLVKRPIEGRIREICQECGWVNYLQLKVTAGVLIEEDNKILLVKRALEPWKGYWYLPAGYVEEDEHPKSAAEREGFEETNLEIHAGHIVNIFYYDDDPRGNGLLILFEGTVKGGELKVCQEAQEIRYFDRDEIKDLQLAGGSHGNAIREWMAGKKPE